MSKQRIMIGWMKVPANEFAEESASESDSIPVKISWEKGKKASRASECGRKLLRALLRDMYGIEISGEKESVSREKDGKPFLIDYPGIYFNISHSGDYAVCAVGEVPLGIDIQYHKKGDHRKLARRIMTQEEWKRYENSGFQEEFLFRCWTRKESFLKYTGEGIRRELRNLIYERCSFIECGLWPGYSGMLCVPEKWDGGLVIREIKEAKIDICGQAAQ